MSLVRADLASLHPVTGMEAKALFNKVLTVADLALQWDDAALDDFKKKNVDFRNFEISSEAFYGYLEKNFMPNIVVQLVSVS
jgi:hypothetical protein